MAIYWGKLANGSQTFKIKKLATCGKSLGLSAFGEMSAPYWKIAYYRCWQHVAMMDPL